MARERNLKALFPESPFLARVKVWTPDRNTLETDGPYDEVSGELLTLVAAIAHPQGEALEAMKRCITELKAALPVGAEQRGEG